MRDYLDFFNKKDVKDSFLSDLDKISINDMIVFRNIYNGVKGDISKSEEFRDLIYHFQYENISLDDLLNLESLPKNALSTLKENHLKSIFPLKTQKIRKLYNIRVAVNCKTYTSYSSTSNIINEIVRAVNKLTYKDTIIEIYSGSPAGTVEQAAINIKDEFIGIIDGDNQTYYHPNIYKSRYSGSGSEKTYAGISPIGLYSMLINYTNKQLTDNNSVISELYEDHPVYEYMKSKNIDTLRKAILELLESLLDKLIHI